ncbi:c-type cytochrome [Microbulbifer elongatus]|uniref:C-type cytochrome n=1 Tax=Microbulbifer elongatus TaxID=86173 RepID=A0ABT1NXD7_9GAMM|nr:c-type cytochrome [Microbulbifer elongatus]
MSRLILVVLCILCVDIAAAQTPIDKGRYLATAADCVACHTAVNGRPMTGGRPFHTPFGKLYSTNITPDKKTGIGNYTLEDFTASMRRGMGMHGNLYPAMPYTSYYRISDEDIAALYAYFMQLPAVEYVAPENDLIFPANLRFGLKAWNWVFFDRQPLQQEAGKSPDWQRGNYLVNALGHCGECHTPRNFAYALKRDTPLAGNVLEGWDAVDIRPQALRRQGWDRASLRTLFRTGVSEQGAAFGEMFSVVKHSLRHLSDSDLDAMITYLLDDDETANETLAQTIGDPQGAAEQYPQGRADYVAYCAGCHGREGTGITLAFAPPMHRNAGVRGENPYNTIAVVLRGLPVQRMSRTNARAGMPSFAKELNNARIAGVVNFMRTAWGASGTAVTEDQIANIREDLREHGFLGEHQ